MYTFGHSANSKTSLVCHGVLLGISAFTFFAAPVVNAAVVVTASEVGGNVVFSGGGTLNLNDLTPNVHSDGWLNGFSSPKVGSYLGAGSGKTTAGTVYEGTSFTGPTSFGPGSLKIIADSYSGDFGGISGSTFPGVLVSDSYVSGSSLFGTSTFINQTFASLGLTSGTYDWVWGSAYPDSYRLCIGSGPCAPASSSVPGPLPLFGAGAAFGWSRRLRKRIAAPLITPPQA